MRTLKQTKRLCGFGILVSLLLLNSACSTSQPGKKFESPDQAFSSLAQAAKAKDKKALHEIFGQASEDLLSSGDTVADEASLELFANKFAAYSEIEELSEDEAVLYIGQEQWPFPIPLIKEDGMWFFDTEEGKEEILNRRIGENELHTISICRQYAKAQEVFAELSDKENGIREYARKFLSSPGRRDGLYWPVKPGEKPSPFGPLFPEAQREGYKINPTEKAAYHGYYYAILTGQGRYATGGEKSYIKDGKMSEGFALLAYPAKWGVSGIMTFIIGPDKIVREKDLGPDTASKAKLIEIIEPEQGWKIVGD